MILDWRISVRPHQTDSKVHVINEQMTKMFSGYLRLSLGPMEDGYM